MNNNNIEFASANTSPFNEGMPFLQDEFYQQQQQQGDNEEPQSIKSFGQADDFRPTFYNPFEIKHRRRTSRAQFKVLEKTFLENPKPNAAIRRWLAQKLVMTPRGVQVWFQNRRAKEKTVNSKKTTSSNTTQVNKEDIIAISSSSESTLSLSPANNDMLVLNSEPLVKQASNVSYDEMFIKQSPMSMISSLSSPSICACNDCHSSPTSFIHSTPMSRTLSYPPFYHSSDGSNADEEELLMTPVTPFVDTQLQQQQQQQQCLYDYPIFMNNSNKHNQYRPQQQQYQPSQDWMNQWPATNENPSYFNHQQQHTSMRRMYSDNSNNNTDNNIMFDDHRRFSHPVINANSAAIAAAAAAVALEEDKFFQSDEVFRRLSEPIFDHSQELNNSFSYNNVFCNNQFDLLPRSTTRYSM